MDEGSAEVANILAQNAAGKNRREKDPERKK
jgi:hypothetical protein